MRRTLSPEALQLPASTKTENSRRPSSTEIARQWLVRFVAVTGQAAEPVLFEIWSEQLGDIPPERLHAACDCLMKTWRFPKLPLPGDVRAQLEDAEENALELEAANAWTELLEWISRYYHPDLGVCRGAPVLPAAVDHSCRAAGGFRWIERCADSELIWCRKTFLADYKTVHETGQVENLLTECQLTRLVSGVIPKPIARKQLLTPAEETPNAAVPVPGMTSAKEVLANLAQSASALAIEMTQEEWDARCARLKRGLVEYLASHNLPPLPDAICGPTERQGSAPGLSVREQTVETETDASVNKIGVVG